MITLPKIFNNGKETILIDTDMLIFRFASRNEYVIDFETQETFGLYKYQKDNPNHIIFSDLETAKIEIIDFIKSIEDYTGIPTIQTVSSPNNWRKEFCKTYKGNRQKTLRPSILGGLRQHIKDTLETLEIDRLEADDILGIYGTQYDNCIISSGDKDMLQIVSEHYDWTKRVFFKVEDNEARRFYYKQILVGDVADNYKGLISFGEAKSDKLLDKATEHYMNYCNKVEDNSVEVKRIDHFYIEHIIKAFKDKGMTMEYLNSQMVLAKILKEPKIRTRMIKY